MPNELTPDLRAASEGESLAIEGHTVTFYENDGERLWHCSCADFERRLTQWGEGFCAHTAIAIMNQTSWGEV